MSVIFEGLYRVVTNRHFLIGVGGVIGASLAGNCICDVKEDLSRDNTLEERSYRAEYVLAEEQQRRDEDYIRGDDDRDHFPAVEYEASLEDTCEGELEKDEESNIESILVEKCVSDPEDVKAPEIEGLRVKKEGKNLYFYGRVSDDKSGLSYFSAFSFKNDKLMVYSLDELNGINEFELADSYFNELNYEVFRGRFKVEITVKDCSGNLNDYVVRCRKDEYCRVLE